jgi:hypothetical protein
VRVFARGMAALLSCALLPPLGADALGAGEGDAASPSLSEAGAELVEQGRLVAAPRYHVVAEVAPREGHVEGTLRVTLPAPAEPLRFRVFAGMPGLDTGVEISDVTVAGDPVTPTLEDALLTVPFEGDPRGRVEVRMRFEYRLPKVEPAGDVLPGLGDNLDPAAIGMLARHDGGATLGHWIPTWLPAGRTDPAPSGFGDIGNFPSAVYRAEITVPHGFRVVSGGVSVDRRQHDGRTTFVEEGVGLRDLAVFVGRKLEHRELDASGVTARVTARRGQRDDLAGVGDEAVAALSGLSQAYVPYPWAELDVVSVPLGASVGGTEWPGMVWIQTDIFGGGLGVGDLADLDDLFGDLDDAPGDLDEVLGDLGIDDLDELRLPGLEGLDSLREFVVAHEVGHEWWHALVGNDAIASPVVDEPLAQFSACLHFEARRPDDAQNVCSFHTDGQYQTMRAFGEPDVPADQPSDAFASSLQYAGVVYGKAPGFYRALGDLIGDEVVLAGLRAHLIAHAFGTSGPDELLASLVAAAPERGAEIEALWARWMDEAHGDEDIGAGDLLGGLGGVDPEALQQILGGILSGTGGR